MSDKHLRLDTPVAQSAGEVIRETFSVCPACLAVLPAQLVLAPDGIRIVRTCPDHGTFASLVWRGRLDLRSWIGDAEPLDMGHTPPCPDGCNPRLGSCMPHSESCGADAGQAGRTSPGQGLCPQHKQGTCCVLYEVTRRCNLHCSFCFADPAQEAPAGSGTSSGGCQGASLDPSLDTIRRDIGDIASKCHPLLQLSGGEPTMRDDLPQIVSIAREAGCPYVQLNTNGLRLAADDAYVASLADAGLSFVFLQFDGIDDSIYEQLRGRALADVKMAAIDNCRRHHLGVTLVPTLVPGVNTSSIGDILRLAVSLAPAVRGVHFQPVSYFGRYPQRPSDDDRYTLDELLSDIDAQAGGLVDISGITPSHCDHPLCGFHGSYLVGADGTLLAQQHTEPEPCCCGEKPTPPEPCCCGEKPASSEPCCSEGSAVRGNSRLTAAERNRAYIGSRWNWPVAPAGQEHESFDTFLAEVRERTFTVTAMAFQDCYDLDIERLQRCSLHVYDAGGLVPFCAHYLTAACGVGPAGAGEAPRA